MWESETEILITKTQMLQLKCAACGFLSDVDMRDKLTSFILKNPPEQKKSSKDKKSMRRAEKERLREGEAADEEMRKLKKEAASKKKAATTGTSKDKVSKKKDHSPPRSLSDENDQADSEEDDDDVQWQTDTSREAAEKRMKEQLSAVTAEMVMLSTVEEKKPVAEVKKAPEQVHENGNSKIPENAHEKLVNEIKELLSSGSSPTQLKTALASNSANPQEKMDALFSALFGGTGKGFAKEVIKKKKYLLALMMMQEEAGAPAQMGLLNGIESFCMKASAEAAKEVALVIKGLYDEDILDEDVIVEWYNKGVKSSPVLKNVTPFIEWLQNAESESEEE